MTLHVLSIEAWAFLPSVSPPQFVQMGLFSSHHSFSISTGPFKRSLLKTEDTTREVNPVAHRGLEDIKHIMDSKPRCDRTYSQNFLGIEVLSHILATAMVQSCTIALLGFSSSSPSFNVNQAMSEMEGQHGGIPTTILRDQKCPLCARIGFWCPYHGPVRRATVKNESRQASLALAKTDLIFTTTFSYFSMLPTDQNYVTTHGSTVIVPDDPQPWVCCKFRKEGLSMAVRRIYCPHNSCAACIEHVKNQAATDVGTGWVSAARAVEYSPMIPGVGTFTTLKVSAAEILHTSELFNLDDRVDWKCCKCFARNSGRNSYCPLCYHYPCSGCDRYIPAPYPGIKIEGTCDSAAAIGQQHSNPIKPEPRPGISLSVIACSSVVKHNAPKAAVPDPRVFRCCSCRVVNSRWNRHCVRCNHVRCFRCSDVHLNLGEKPIQATSTGGGDHFALTEYTKNQFSTILKLVGGIETKAFTIVPNPACENDIAAAALPLSCANECWMCHICRWPNNRLLTGCGRCQHPRCEYCNTLEGALSVGASAHNGIHVRVYGPSPVPVEYWWYCHLCTALNHDRNASCSICGRIKTPRASSSAQSGAQGDHSSPPSLSQDGSLVQEHLPSPVVLGSTWQCCRCRIYSVPGLFFCRNCGHNRCKWCELPSRRTPDHEGIYEQ